MSFSVKLGVFFGGPAFFTHRQPNGGSAPSGGKVGWCVGCRAGCFPLHVRMSRPSISQSESLIGVAKTSPRSAMEACYCSDQFSHSLKVGLVLPRSCAATPRQVSRVCRKSVPA